MTEDSAAAKALGFTVVEAIRAGSLDGQLVSIGLAARQREKVVRGDEPPARTPEMVRLGQVWAWMWDIPRPPVFPGEDGYVAPGPNDTGRWEVRGTGALL